MKITSRISIHLDAQRKTPRVDAVQCDANTRVLKISLYSNGSAWSVPDETDVSVAYRKSDGTKGWYNKLPNGKAACSVSDNVVTVTLAPQVLTAPGLVKVVVIMQDSDTLDQLATFPVEIHVEFNPAAGNTISNDYYKYSTMAEVNTALNEMTAEINTALSVAKAYYIRIEEDEDGNLIADKLFDEIRSAYYRGSSLYANYNGIILPLVAPAGSVNRSCVFQGTVLNTYYHLTIYGDGSAVMRIEDMASDALIVHSQGNEADVALISILDAVDAGRNVVLLYENLRLVLVSADDAGATFISSSNSSLTIVYMDDDGFLTVNMPTTEAEYYETFSGAIADINAGVRTGKCANGTGNVKVVTNSTGKVTVILLADCEESAMVTISADVDIVLAGHTLYFTDPGAYLGFANGNCAIWGEVEGSRIVKEGFDATSVTRLIQVTCEHFEIHGGEYRLTGTCQNKNAMMFVVGSANKYCLFEDCNVSCNIHSTGETGEGTTYYLTTGIQNTGSNTIVRGGNWAVNTTGNTMARMGASAGTLTTENTEISVEAANSYAVALYNDASTVSGVTKTGILHVKNSSVKAHTSAETTYEACGIHNSKAGTVAHVNDTTIFTDSQDFDAHEDGLGTHSIAVVNAVDAICHLTNVIAHGTHSCLSNQGKIYVNGGTYTGFCHGGIYCSHGTEGEAFVNDAYLRDGYYEGIYTDYYASNTASCVGGFYIGGGEDDRCSNMVAYFDNCKIEGVYRALVMRGSDGEQNNKAYLSNCTFISGDVARGINIHDNTNHLVYLGEGCNYTAENATHPEQVVQTMENYRRVHEDKALDGHDFDALRNRPVGGEVDPEAIEDAVEKYLTENPPAGGGTASERVWKVLNEVTVNEIVDSVTIDADSEGEAFSAKHMLVHMYLPKYEYEGNTGTGYSTYAINGKTIGRLGYCYPPSNWENGYFLFDIMACGDLVYVRCYKVVDGAYLSEGRTLEQIFHFAINENVGLYEGIFSFEWSLFNRKVLPGSTFKVYGEVS